jgi:hypothetical protein
MFRLLAIFQSFSNTDQLFEFLTVRVFIGKDFPKWWGVFVCMCVCVGFYMQMWKESLTVKLGLFNYLK